MYVQETGRASRDNLPACAVLYFNNHDICDAHVSPDMKAYCRNKPKCRRSFLMSTFADTKEGKSPSPLHDCCDQCATRCPCSQCNCTDIPVSQLLEEPVKSIADSKLQIDRLKKEQLFSRLNET